MPWRRPDSNRCKTLRNRGREMRGDMPLAEILLWQHLRGDQLGVRFRRQFRIGEFITDFASPLSKLVIELDGDSHADRAEYDILRSKAIEADGYRVIRFSNQDVIENVESVVAVIAGELVHERRPSPLPSPWVQGEGGRVLSDHSIASLSEQLSEANLHPSAVPRILRNYWASHPLALDQINIAKPTQAWLHQHFVQPHSNILHRHDSADGTIKLLLGFRNSGTAECVLMPSHRPDRAAVCVSSQVGCAMGCDFCASTQSGLSRNLSPGEIVEQFMHLRFLAATQNRRIATVVFMGMGEPLANLDNVAQAIRILTSRGLGNLAKRAITVSTVGLVPQIDELADLDLGVSLALSLHAPDDETRGRLVPANRKWKVADILAAAKRFQDRHGRPVNVEYCLLADVNDSDAQADLLAERMHGFRAHVNLIPYNAIGSGLSGVTYRRPADDRIASFIQRLRDQHVVAHIRQTRGDDVAAACGQLAGMRVEGRGMRISPAALVSLHSPLTPRHSPL